MTSQSLFKTMPVSVPLIDSVLKHLATDPGAFLPTVVPADAMGARIFGRYVVMARDADDLRFRIRKTANHPKLTGIIGNFAHARETRLWLDHGSWEKALGTGQRDMEHLFRRSHRRCLHLVRGLESMLGSIGIPPLGTFATGSRVSSTIDNASTHLGTMSLLLPTFIVTAFAMNELVWGRRPKDGIRPALASALVESLDRVESLLFGLVSAMSISLNGVKNPDVIAMTSNEAMFRESFEAEEEQKSTTFTLAELEAKLGGT